MTLFAAMVFAQTAFAFRNLAKQGDLLAQYQADVEGVLRIYEVLLKANPKDRLPYLNDLIQRRESGTLEMFVKERAEAVCKKRCAAYRRRFCLFTFSLILLFDLLKCDFRFRVDRLLTFFPPLIRFSLDMDES
jgi:hypothetical protein